MTQSDQLCIFAGFPFWLLQDEGKQGHQLGGCKRASWQRDVVRLWKYAEGRATDEH